MHSPKVFERKIRNLLSKSDREDNSLKVKFAKYSRYYGFGNLGDDNERLYKEEEYLKELPDTGWRK